MKKVLLAMIFLVGCEASDTRGMCRDFEVCETSEGQRDCHNLRVWFECNEEVEEQCEWRELDRERSAPNEDAVPCEQCDYNQCPEEEG